MKVSRSRVSPSTMALPTPRARRDFRWCFHFSLLCCPHLLRAKFSCKKGQSYISDSEEGMSCPYDQEVLGADGALSWRVMELARVLIDWRSNEGVNWSARKGSSPQRNFLFLMTTPSRQDVTDLLIDWSKGDLRPASRPGGFSRNGRKNYYSEN